jgi:hypothetical protein
VQDWAYGEQRLSGGPDGGHNTLRASDQDVLLDGQCKRGSNEYQDEIADKVVIVGGKYKEKSGVVVKLTPKMVVVCLSMANIDVRVYQYHVRKRENNDDLSVEKPERTETIRRKKQLTVT